MPSRTDQFDVVVAGGGSSGVAAAAAAARTGADTLLVERFSCLGGASTMRSVVTYCGLYTLDSQPKIAVGGIAKEVSERLEARGAITGPIRHRGVFVVFEPEAVKIVLDELVAEAGVTVMHGAFLAEAEREDGKILSVTVATHSGLHKIKAKAFVDCTGEGDLAARAGAATRYGNGMHVNLGTLSTRFGGIARDASVTVEDVVGVIAAMGEMRSTVTKDRSVIARLPISGDLVCYLASEDYNPLDNFSMSGAERRGRQQAWKYLDEIKKIPGCEAAYLVTTGPEFGTRESRHLKCLSQLTWHDVGQRKKFNDCIALGTWGAEWHDRDSFESSFDYPPGRATYEIPLSCLQSIDTPNLVCGGRLADGDRKASAAIRVMGTAFATGQAAGVAAALSAAGEWTASDVQKILRVQGCILSPSEIKS
ncbi:MAG: FAD-dependent oxidoreductase [Pseudomonadota bacterium]|nr:FAD-dependent oxidoreductase [Pseudomonadota bacterium]